KKKPPLMAVFSFVWANRIQVTVVLAALQIILMRHLFIFGDDDHTVHFPLFEISNFIFYTGIKLLSGCHTSPP
ncbi:hypothetical protein J8A28_04775, partial [Vibrio parahaemolyticus]|nr:hypothetical protein [Vibrio parahaemolyticus]